MRRKLIGLLLIIIPIAACILFTLWRWRTNPFVDLYYIRSDIVSDICNHFDISQDDNFCDDSGFEEVADLEQAFERRFPLETATYEIILPYIETLRSRPIWQCFYRFTDLAIGNCPPPLRCSGSAGCTVILAEDGISMHILFTRRGYVREYIFRDPPGD
jgi:hypothetical protein